MVALIETFDITQILMPVQHPEDARWDAVTPGPSLTVVRGTFAAQKTSDMKMYALNTGAADGTQLAIGIFMYGFITDANGKIFYGPNAVSSARIGPWSTTPMYITGIFDPNELQTSAAPVAQVLTFTPTTPAVSDVDSLTFNFPSGQTRSVSFTVTTATAAAVSAGLIAAWNNDPILSSLAVASGTTTVILTSTLAGNSDNITSSVVGTGTLPKVVTTAASGRAITDITGHGLPAARVLQNGYWYVQ